MLPQIIKYFSYDILSQGSMMRASNTEYTNTSVGVISFRRGEGRSNYPEEKSYTQDQTIRIVNIYDRKVLSYRLLWLRTLPFSLLILEQIGILRITSNLSYEPAGGKGKFIYNI